MVPINVIQTTSGATLYQKVVVTGVGAYGERVEREPKMGVYGQSPQRSPGAKPLVGDQGGEAAWS